MSSSNLLRFQRCSSWVYIGDWASNRKCASVRGNTVRVVANWTSVPLLYVPAVVVMATTLFLHWWCMTGQARSHLGIWTVYSVGSASIRQQMLELSCWTAAAWMQIGHRTPTMVRDWKGGMFWWRNYTHATSIHTCCICQPFRTFHVRRVFSSTMPITPIVIVYCNVTFSL